jgi:ribA/ribD-fused uncharacterized protein
MRHVTAKDMPAGDDIQGLIEEYFNQPFECHDDDDNRTDHELEELEELGESRPANGSGEQIPQSSLPNGPPYLPPDSSEESNHSDYAKTPARVPSPSPSPSPPSNQAGSGHNIDEPNGESHGTKSADDFVFFASDRAKNGFLSQWYKCEFKVAKNFQYLRRPENEDFALDTPEDEITFLSAEQYMMFAKAMYFNDKASADRILTCKTPQTAKRLGKAIPDFSQQEWEIVRERVCMNGNLAKFSQNDNLKQMLLQTGTKSLVESRKDDRIWGVGYDAKHALANYDTWGLNLLGQCLCRVREELANDTIDMADDTIDVADDTIDMADDTADMADDTMDTADGPETTTG